MGLKAKSSVNVVFGSLRANAYQAKQGVEDEIEAAAEAVAKTAAAMAPRDTGSLERSIEVVKQSSGSHVRFMVRVNPNARRLPRGENGRFKSGRREPVARYAMRMEDDHYKLGRRSQEKDASQLGSGKRVGRQFFRRAKSLEWPKFQRRIAAMLARKNYKYRWRFGR